VVPNIYNVLTAPHTQDSIFNWTYLRCYWRYVDNSMHLVLLSLCQIPVYAIWTVGLTYTMHLQLRIIRLQYSTERIFAAIGLMSTIQRASYCKLCAKYSAHPPVFALLTVVPNIHNVLTDPHIQDSIFSWTYLRCYWRYVDNSASVILQPSCQYCAHPPVYAMWTVVPDISNVITAPHIRASIFN
jgi:hypothetical protein